MSDVCLILEGTYPYVAGGVSTCVYQLIKETPHIKYSIVYIGATQDSLKEYKYPIPDNVKLIKELFLFDYDLKGKTKELGIDFDFAKLTEFHKGLRKGKVDGFKEFYHKFFDPDKRVCDPIELMESKEAWDFLVQFYERQFTGENGLSFIDYFYSWRFTHYPMFKILSADIPRAHLYHSLCTGYAGLLGAAASIKYKRPYVLTEHGIYSHEREIEIYQADWIYNTDKDYRAKKNLSYFKEWWIKTFHFFSKVAYHHADVITTLYQGNKERQIGYGAKRSKIELIPNGIRVEDFTEIKDSSEKNEKKAIALVGRVVPIKDIKTFIKSISYVKSKTKDFVAYIMGPTDEDEDYFEDCKRLVGLLGLEEHVVFTGRVDIKEYFKKVDLLVLSSISEGQPMVILEGYAAGIPTVATDVGGCKELIYGGSELDKEIGPGGLVVPFGKPDDLGEAITKLLLDEEKLEKLGQNGFKRVKKFYQENMTVTNYMNVYNRYLSSSL
ncbi:MAG: group 1 glycosyl transferase [Halobacteriovorax sp.]|nr:group 1 glycosyl transferase [Halobacteriovorax sp.]|tara:strand:- start:5258 stop:6745 length:1488 start_codon:yes stop_codon:yes gene_type:complete